jgi:dolichyl-phosphate beta-glucosyltransferase
MAIDPLPVDFHLVIPCFEESRRLPEYLDSLSACLEEQAFQSRILIVDDGSSQEDRKKLDPIIRALQKRHRLILDPLYLERNYGKGYAVRAGWNTGQGAKWLAFVDADGATPEQEVVRIFNFIERKDDDSTCYLGSRVRMLGYSVERGWKRHLIGRVYATLVGVLINQSVYDTQCGFKIISQRAFSAIGPILEENRFAFDSELIAALADARFKLQEIPLDWRDVAGSKVSFIRDPLKMVISLFEIQKRRKKWTLLNKVN